MSQPTIDINVSNEKLIIGTLLNNPKQLDKYIHKIHTDDFVSKEHKKIWQGLMKFSGTGKVYSADTFLRYVDGLSYKKLVDIQENYNIPVANLDYHISELKNAAIKVKIIDDLDDIYSAIEDNKQGVQEIRHSAVEILKTIESSKIIDDGSLAGKKLIEHTYNDFDRIRKEGKSQFVSSGFTALDKYLFEGIRKQRFITLAARPGMGKSTFVSNFLVRVRNRLKVLFLCLEPGKQTVIDQMIAIKLRVDMEKIIKEPHLFKEKQMEKIRLTLENLYSNGNIVLNTDIINLDMLEIHLRHNQYDVVAIDLFTMMLDDLDPKAISQSLYRLKEILVSNNIAGLVVHQIKRIERKKDMRPYLHELKGSGAFEEVSDLVLFLHRLNYYEADALDEDILEVHIAKQRRGVSNQMVAYRFFPEQCRIGKYDESYMV